MSTEERGPGPATVERVIAAWQRANDNQKEDADLSADQRAINGDITEFTAERDLDRLLDRQVAAILHDELREAEADKLIKAMAARKQRYRQRAEHKRRQMLDMLAACDRTSHPGAWGTFTLYELPGSVVITEEADIPAEYVTEKVTRTIDRRALKADLVEGVVIPGAVLSNGGLGMRFTPPRVPPEEIN
jgi:hypothetical protein